MRHQPTPLIRSKRTYSQNLRLAGGADLAIDGGKPKQQKTMESNEITTGEVLQGNIIFWIHRIDLAIAMHKYADALNDVEMLRYTIQLAEDNYRQTIKELQDKN